MKLGIYVIHCDDLPLDWFAKAKPAIAVSMDANPDYWRQVKTISPNTFIMGRHYFESQPFDGNYWFNEMRGDVEQMRGIYNCWMSINEPAVWNQVGATALRDATRQWSDLMHGVGVKTVAYSFPEGHPEVDLWQYLKGHGCDYVGLHEYDFPTMNRTQGYRCLRYRKVYTALGDNIPIIIAETGLDGGVTNEETGQPFAPVQGWKKAGDETHYLESLGWYNSELAKDTYVTGAVIFAAKWNQGNGTFDMGDCKSIRDYIGSSPTPPNGIPFRGGYKITQNFGENPDYYKPYGFNGHEGIDLIPLTSDWDVCAVESGVVVRDVDVPKDNYGIYCVVWNRETRRGWWYCHLENNLIKTGDSIALGQTLGRMGATGQVTGSHLHLGLRLTDANGAAINTDNGYKGFIDPLPVLKGEEMREQLDKNWPELQIERYTGSEPYFKLVEWEVVKTGGGEHAIKVQTQDEAGKPMGHVTVWHTWPQNEANREDLSVELKDIGGGNMVYFAEVIMGGEGASNFDSAGHGPHNIEILPGDKVYGAGLPMNEHRLYRYVMRKTLPSQTFEQAAWAGLPALMPINTEAWLYKYAKTILRNPVPQTEEFRFTFNGKTYARQVWNAELPPYGGLTWVEVDHWDVEHSGFIAKA